MSTGKAAGASKLSEAKREELRLRREAKLKSGGGGKPSPPPGRLGVDAKDASSESGIFDADVNSISEEAPGVPGGGADVAGVGDGMIQDVEPRKSTESGIFDGEDNEDAVPQSVGDVGSSPSTSSRAARAAASLASLGLDGSPHAEEPISHNRTSPVDSGSGDGVTSSDLASKSSVRGERESRARRADSGPNLSSADMGSSTGRVSRADRLKQAARRGDRGSPDLGARTDDADTGGSVTRSPRSQQLRANRAASSRALGRRGGGVGDDGDHARVREMEAKLAELQGKVDVAQFQKDQLKDEIELLKDDLETAQEKMREAVDAKEELLTRLEGVEEDLANEKERGEYDRNDAQETIEALKDELEAKAAASNMAQQQVEQLTKLVETQKSEIAMLGSAGASSEKDLVQKIAALEAQVKEQKAKFEKEKSLLEEQGHGSSGNRPNRLAQLQELSDARQRDKEKYETVIEEYKQQIESMRTEMDELALVNSEMVKALEDMSAGGDGASSSFELKGLQEQIRQLEGATHRQLEVIQTNETTMDEMGRELVAKTDECEELQAELVNARSDQRAAESKIGTLEAQLKKLEAESQHLKKNRGKVQGEQEEQLDELKARLENLTEERDALLVAKGELESTKAVLEREIAQLKREAKENEEEWGEQSKDLKERLNDAIQARWSLAEALRAAGVDPDEVDAALLSEKMQSSSKEQAGAIKAMQENLAKAEKTIKEMREVYAKTKSDAEAAVASRDAALAEQTAKIAKLTLALKQANDAKEELEAELQQYEVVEEEGGEEEEVEEEEVEEED